jgi:hypothetical protein
MLDVNTDKLLYTENDKGKKKSSEAESFKQMNIKCPTHLKMAI